MRSKQINFPGDSENDTELVESLRTAMTAIGMCGGGAEWFARGANKNSDNVNFTKSRAVKEVSLETGHVQFSR